MNKQDFKNYLKLLHVMKFYLLSIMILVGCISCNNHPTTIIERKGEPSIYSVQTNDAEMNRAMLTAIQTLDSFKEALLSKNKDYKFFALKSRFITSNGSEHIWLRDIIIKDKKYVGIVANLPESIKDVKLGDTISILKNNISDWMYLDKKILRGGYTIRLLRKRMTDTERKQFDSKSGLIIEE